MMVLNGCDESLPQYEDPKDILDGFLSARYDFLEDNTIKAEVLVRNLFDETLQGPALLSGSFTISMKRLPHVSRTIPLSPANLLRARSYDPVRRILTIDPGESIVVGVTWNYLDDQGRDVREEFFRYLRDPTCDSLRNIAMREIFIVTATVRVFDRSGDVRPEGVELSICHIDAWVPSTICPAITPATSCGLIGM